MSLRALCQQATAIAFAAAGDVPISAVLKTGPSNSYNPATGETTQTWATATTVQVIAYNDKNEKLSPTSAENTLKNYLIQPSSYGLAPASINQTSIIIAEGQSWQVLAVQSDPAAATIKLTVQS